MIDDSQPNPPTVRFPHLQRLLEFGNNVGTRFDREREADLDYLTAGAGDVGLDGLLHGAVRVVEEEDSVAGLKGGGGESPGGVLEDNRRGGGGVIDDGDLVDVVGVDEALDEDARSEDGGLEGVVVEGVGLAEEEQLVALLGGDDGGRAAAEAAVIDPGDSRVVVRELRLDLRWNQ